jgi:uncharacterized pyridoxal phosphate-dependent enzyme
MPTHNQNGEAAIPPIYQKLNVRPIIHAAGTETPAGGTLMPPEVVDAMVQASTAFVMINELNEAVGKQIADATGAEAGYVTAGSASGMLLAAAACIAGTDETKIRRLPNTDGMANEVIIHRSHRVRFDKAFEVAGGKFVEIGYPRNTLISELEEVISDRTACVAYIDSPSVAQGALDFSTIVEVAHRHDIPVIVDAASTLPPVNHLRKWIDSGADLVIYSGGKGIRGPQNSGLLAGRADLIAAAAANGFPNPGVIGRAAKVSKETMAGLSAALDLFLRHDHQRDFAEHHQQAETIVDGLKKRDDVVVELVADPTKNPAPIVNLSPNGAANWTAAWLAKELMNWEPRIYCQPFSNALRVRTHSLFDGEAEIITEAVDSILNRL